MSTHTQGGLSSARPLPSNHVQGEDPLQAWRSRHTPFCLSPLSARYPLSFESYEIDLRASFSQFCPVFSLRNF